MRVTMQYNIDIVGRNFRRNMNQPKLQPVTLKIHNERPVVVPVAIPAHHCERGSDCFQVQGDGRLANIAQVPDLVRFSRQIDNP